jgi:hypothetical protein
MASKKYIEQSDHLIKAIEIAIDVLKKIPPKGFEEHDTRSFVGFYAGCKESLVNPDPKYSNLASLKYDIEAVFTYFNEASGETVNEFWKRIKESGLPYERENKLEKILLKKKIRNQQDYDYVIDNMVPFKQEGIINEREFELLNQLVGEFEFRRLKKKRDLFN